MYPECHPRKSIHLYLWPPLKIVAQMGTLKNHVMFPQSLENVAQLPHMRTGQIGQDSFYFPEGKSYYDHIIVGKYNCTVYLVSPDNATTHSYYRQYQNRKSSLQILAHILDSLPGFTAWIRDIQWTNLQKYISSVRTNVFKWYECILLGNIHITLKYLLWIWWLENWISSNLPLRMRVRDYHNYITMDHTHLGELILH